MTVHICTPNSGFGDNRKLYCGASPKGQQHFPVALTTRSDMWDKLAAVSDCPACLRAYFTDESIHGGLPWYWNNRSEESSDAR